MDSPVLLRQLLRAPSASLNLLTSPSLPRSRNLLLLLRSSAINHNLSARHVSSLPRVAQPSFWSSMLPKFLRPSTAPTTPKAPKSKEWNPATPYIILGLLIGSQAIQTIALRNEVLNFSRRADAKIGLLREVIDRVRRGEEVDVERLLGTGDEAKEREWEEVLREIEEEEALFQSKKRRKAIKDAAVEEEAARAAEESTVKTHSTGKLRFY